MADLPVDVVDDGQGDADGHDGKETGKPDFPTVMKR